MIKELKQKYGLKIESDKTILGQYYNSCGKKLRKNNTKSDAIDYLAHRLSITLKHLHARFNTNELSKSFTWVLRDSTAENTYGFSTHPKEKDKKVLILAFNLYDTHTIKNLLTAYKLSDKYFYIQAECDSSQVSTLLCKRNAFTDGIIRHELGHILTKKQDLTVVRSWLKQYTPNWWMKHVSEYALIDSYEALAEIFALVTSKNYTEKKLPKKMEDLVLTMLERM